MNARPNDHLAVLLPKHLWKPDSASSTCDNFYCRVSFGLFERRHHCRKCGGCFCNACTSRTTPLLDTSALPFVYPPRNHSITEYESPVSPIVDARVCDDCWDQLHGVSRSPASLARVSIPRKSRPSYKRRLTSPLPREPSESSLSSQSSASPRTRSLRDRPPSPSSTTSSLRSTHSHPVVRTQQLPLSLERSYGELDAYPLKRSSVLCKATGGGRWEPSPITVLDGYRKPVVGGKAPYEVMMEAQEEEERRRKSNPVVVDGDFKYRWVVGRRGD